MADHFNLADLAKLGEGITPGKWRALKSCAVVQGDSCQVHTMLTSPDYATCKDTSNARWMDDCRLIAAAPDLLRQLRRTMLALAAERGETHDEAGEPYPWTVAGWRPQSHSGNIWSGHGRYNIDGLAGMEAVHDELGLPPLVPS